MSILGTIILFFIVLGVLVCIHELGHYLAAKASRVRVDEFGFGFPPRLIGKKLGQTLYSINLIPLGGFVRIKGIAGENIEQIDTEAHETDEEAQHDADSFAVQPLWKKFAILFAGIFMNLILAWVLFSATYISGVQVPTEDPNASADVIVAQVLAGSPAADAGIRTGDLILSKNGEALERVQDIQGFTQEDAGSVVAVEILQGKEKRVVDVHLREIETPETRYVGMGVSLVAVETIKYPIGKAIIMGGEQVVGATLAIFKGLGGMIFDLFRGSSPIDQLAGPIGIAQLTGQAYEYGYSQLFQLMALLSLNLAIFNFLPIPGLDGGRIAVLAIESILRKPLNRSTEAIIHNIGFLLLISLILLVTYKDIARIFG